MSWLAPWLGQSFACLYSAFRTEPFTSQSAASSLAVPSGRSNLVLSRLVRQGWAVRTQRGAYRLLSPEAIFALMRSDAQERLSGASFYPTLQLALSEVFRVFGSELVSVALFGSAARGRAKPKSDVDLAVVLDPSPSSWVETHRKISAVCDAATALGPRTGARTGPDHAVQLVLLDLPALAREPLLLLDLTEDARILFDRSGTLASALDRTRAKLRRRGAKRIWLAPDDWIWDLAPGRGGPPIEAL